MILCAATVMSANSAMSVSSTTNSSPARRDTVSTSLKQQVADVVTQGVVDALETIEVHEQDRCFGFPAARPRYNLVQPVVEEPPVWQARQQVVIGQTVEAVFVEFSFGYVAQNE